MKTDLSSEYLHDMTPTAEAYKHDSSYPIWVAKRVRPHRYYKGEPPWWSIARPNTRVSIEVTK